ncbi:YdcA family protein [Ectopseudomonas mendocina]|uniref:hypothetical protein n=1 Tax=Ectopseudomonas mendocina TaxID=300 RepID=UPI00376F057A
MPRLVLFLLLVGLANFNAAANQPCSGKKGGIARCDGELWVCNDGSISGSKRNCSAAYGGSSAPLRAAGNVASECPCGTGVLCTGPRGGQYCVTASGNKSYRKK